MTKQPDQPNPPGKQHTVYIGSAPLDGRMLAGIADRDPGIDYTGFHGGKGFGYAHVVAGMYIGDMPLRPMPEEFHGVLTLAQQSGAVHEGIKHKHLHIPYGPMPYESEELITQAADWVGAFVASDHKVLVRSEGGKNRPGLVVGAAIIHMGGRFGDAISCIMGARPAALGDFRYQRWLREYDARINGSKPAV
jgi:hypothetical protein